MPPPLLMDPAGLDFSHPVADRRRIEQVNPHRHEFMLLDGVVLLDLERGLCAGYHDIRSDAFWARGHIPGRPLFPGVLMIESAAQLASFLYGSVFGANRFVGFVGADGVKFRGLVEPPCRFVVLAMCRQLKPRRFISAVQGLVNNTLVFEGKIIGMPV